MALPTACWSPAAPSAGTTHTWSSAWNAIRACSRRSGWSTRCRRQRRRPARLDAAGAVRLPLPPALLPRRAVLIDLPAHDALWRAAAETDAIMQFHLWPRHAVALARMIERHPDVRVIIDHLSKPDVAEASPYPSFQPVLRLADSRRSGSRSAITRSLRSSPSHGRTPLLRRRVAPRLRPARMIWGTGYAGGGRLVPLAQALEYVQRHSPVGG